MFELFGKYNKAKVFTDNIDNAAISQIINLLNQESVQGSRIRMMPDVHAGEGCTIGTTMTITDKIIPNLVGSDIGCGMTVAKFKEQSINLNEMDKLMYVIDRKPSLASKDWNLSSLFCLKHINTVCANKEFGTLGSGNHFVELDRDNENDLYIVVHSGSHHLGIETARYYQNAGYRELRKSNIPKNYSYVSGTLMEQYIHDIKIVQEYAYYSRLNIINQIVSAFGLTISEVFNTIHNYIDTDEMILRKGAVSAKKNEKLIIPMNMRDGSLICTGLGNDDWNQSAPHGAGRIMSRSEAKENISLDEFKNTMSGIYTSSVNIHTIDESPMAYKTMESIIKNIKDTVKIDKIIKPVYNYKSGGQITMDNRS